MRAFRPALQGSGARIAIISIVALAIALINLVGIRQATIVSNGLTMLKVSLLLVFGVVGVLTIQAWPAAPATLPPPGDFSDAMLLGIFAFTGFEAALVAAGETRNPRRDVPFAVAMSLLIVLILYAGVQIVCIASVPSLATSTAPFADAAVVLWGPVGEQVITLGAVVIMLGSLNSGFLATSRLPFAFAEQGDMPRMRSPASTRSSERRTSRFWQAQCSSGSRPSPARFCPRSRSRRARAWSCISRDASR